MKKRCASLLVLTIAAAAACACRAYAADYVLLIGGLGGTEEYSAEFAQSLSDLRGLLMDEGGYEQDNIRLLAGGEQPGQDVDGIATLNGILAELERLQAETSDADTLLLVLVGHGQSDYRQPKFNIPGLDLTAERLGTALDALPVRDQRLLLAFGCSGHFAELLADPMRTILASGDGPRQIYKSVLPPYCLEALKSEDTDLDMDGRVSCHELFLVLSEKVGAHFKELNALPTENPSLEDNGDGRVTTLQEGMDAGDGENARRTILIPAPAVVRTNGIEE